MKSGASFILDRLDGVTTSEDSREIADYLAALQPEIQATTLLELMRRYDEPGTFGMLHRYLVVGERCHFLRSRSPSELDAIVPMRRVNSCSNSSLISGAPVRA